MVAVVGGGGGVGVGWREEVVHELGVLISMVLIGDQ